MKIKSKYFLFIFILLSFLLVACESKDDEKKEEVIEYGKETLLPEKVKLIEGYIVKREDKIIYVSDKNEMIAVHVRVEDSKNMKPEEINKYMTKYEIGSQVSVHSNAYTTNDIKEVYVDEKDIKNISTKNEYDDETDLALVDVLNKAIAHSYIYKEDITYLYVDSYFYNKENDLWKVNIQLTSKKEGESIIELEFVDEPLDY